MKIMVISANGRLGQYIVKEAIDRNIDVTAVIRQENKTSTNTVLIKDLFDLNEEDVKDVDVLVNCFGTRDESKFSDFKRSIEHLSNLISQSKKRLIVVGGAGSLYLNETQTKQLYQNDDFPTVVKPTAKAAAEALSYIRTRSDVLWTYISPAINFVYTGEKLGSYQIAGEVLTFNEKQESFISYQDYAKALIDIALGHDYIQKRISLYQI